MKLTIPSVAHPTDRPNFSSLDFGGIKIWFSYETPIAFWTAETGEIVRQNDWGPTTGKHLSWVDNGNKHARVDGATFERRLNMIIDNHVIVEQEWVA